MWATCSSMAFGGYILNSQGILVQTWSPGKIFFVVVMCDLATAHTLSYEPMPLNPENIICIINFFS
jgi:hypothetical protein